MSPSISAIHKETITVREAARLLSVRPYDISMMIHRGQLRAVPLVITKRRIAKEDVERAIATRAEG